MESIFAGDAGLGVIVDCGRDVSLAVGPAILVRRPDGAVLRWEASVFEMDGETRFLRYVTRPGDLSMPGLYKAQASLSLGAWTGLGETARFIVRNPFE